MYTHGNIKTEEGATRDLCDWVHRPSFTRCTHFIRSWGDHILIKQALHLPVLLIIGAVGAL